MATRADTRNTRLNQLMLIVQQHMTDYDVQLVKRLVNGSRGFGYANLQIIQTAAALLENLQRTGMITSRSIVILQILVWSIENIRLYHNILEFVCHRDEFVHLGRPQTDIDHDTIITMYPVKGISSISDVEHVHEAGVNWLHESTPDMLRKPDRTWWLIQRSTTPDIQTGANAQGDDTNQASQVNQLEPIPLPVPELTPPVPAFERLFKKRSCTDIPCCLIFLLCLAGMITCSVLGFMNGNPIQLLYPTDSQGNICGTGDQVNKPNLLFFDLLKCHQSGLGVAVQGCPTPQICVKDCPSSYFVYVESLISNNESQLTCKDNVAVNTTIKDIESFVMDEECAAYTIPSSPVLGRCIPSIFTDFVDLAATLTSNNHTLENAEGTLITGEVLQASSQSLAYFMSATEFEERIFKDIEASWPQILVFLGLAMIHSFLWLVLLRWITGVVFWISILALLVGLEFCQYHTLTTYMDISDNANYSGFPAVFTTNLSYYTNMKETWLVLAIVSSVIRAVLLLMLLFICGKLRLAVKHIKEGTRAMGNTIVTLFFPVLTSILQLALLAYWAASAIYIASMGKAQFYTNGTNTSDDGGLSYYIKRIPCEDTGIAQVTDICSFVKYGGNTYTIYMQIIMLFMSVWCFNFVNSLGQMTLAGAFASYYHRTWQDPSDIPAFHLMGSLWRCLRNHLGSLAFGSFSHLFLFPLQLTSVRVFLEYLDSKLKGSNNRAAKFLVKYLKCCSWCLETLTKFINTNAYVLTAVEGDNFCTSAQRAYLLIAKNKERTVVDFVLFLTKLFVIAAATAGAFFWFQGHVPVFVEHVPALNYQWTPIVLVGVGSYLIASCLFSVYHMSMDTYILVSADKERRDSRDENCITQL